MTRQPVTSAELAPTARTRVRLPESYAPARFFPGWGPELGR
jgi:hypothetical protein